MKKFTCKCIDSQFKSPDQVYVGYDDQHNTEISCIYRPKGKVSFRRIKLEVNYCPECGAKLEEMETKSKS